MKKLLILALVALVAGAAFAETAPAFSGDFEFYSGFDFINERAEVGNSGDAEINLNGIVDEFSTVSAELGVGNDVADGEATGTEVTMDAFTLTTDITGALGVDGPVGVSTTWGYKDAEPANYADVAGYEDTTMGNDTDDYVGIEIAISIADTVTIIGTVFPGTYTDWDTITGANEAVGAVEVQFAIDAISANVFMTYDGNASNDVLGMEIGATASYVVDALEVGFGTVYLSTGTAANDSFKVGLGFLYNITDSIAAGLAYATTNMLNDNFAATTFVALNTEITLTEMFGLYASFVLGNFNDIEFKVDAGVQVSLGAVTYTLGYDYGGAGFKTPDWEIGDAAGEADEGMYFKVSASF